MSASDVLAPLSFAHWPQPAIRFDAAGQVDSWNLALAQLCAGLDDPDLPLSREGLAAALPWLCADPELLEGLPQGRCEVRGELAGRSWLVSCHRLAAETAGLGIVAIFQELDRAEGRPADGDAGLAVGLAQAYDCLPDAICVIDPATRTILSANRAFLDVYGEEQPVVGRTCFSVTCRRGTPCDTPEQRCGLLESCESGQCVIREHIHHAADGNVRILEVATAPLAGSGRAGQLVVHAIRDVTARRSCDSVRLHTDHDHLTGLPNRMQFLEQLRRELDRATREQGLVAVLHLDIDHFKKINDSFGHTFGDQLLRVVARRLAGSLRGQDLVSRAGGDDFLVVLPGIVSEAEAEGCAALLHETLAEPCDVGGQELVCTLSIGIALFPDDGQEADDLVKNAELAMRQAKQTEGCASQRFSLETGAQAMERLVLESALRQALDQQEFLLHYQPQVAADSGRLVGGEALIRWQRPFLGMVPPLKFIPLAEETGLILPIGEWVLTTVFDQMTAWRELNLPLPRLGINLSARQFRDGKLVEKIAELLRQSAVDPALVELELTESLLMQDAAEAARTLGRLKDLGVGLAVDDFGTGYSSLSYLKNFPLDRLKIDRSFVKDIGTAKDDGTIAAAVIALAQALRLEVVAEGVETREQYEFLRDRGCEEIQGYYFSRPLGAEDFRGWLTRETATHPAG